MHFPEYKCLRKKKKMVVSFREKLPKVSLVLPHGQTVEVAQR